MFGYESLENDRHFYCEMRLVQVRLVPQRKTQCGAMCPGKAVGVFLNTKLPLAQISLGLSPMSCL